MTQQGDTTSQQTSEGQPSSPAQSAAAAVSAAPGARPAEPTAPRWPSPYLTEGQSAPEAYPAPPQPGKPPYGTVTGGYSAGPQSGYGQSRYGQPGYGQRDPYGRPAQPGLGGLRGRPIAGGRPMAQRDQTLAGAWERLLACTLDWLVIFVAAFLVQHTQMLRFWHQVHALLVNAQTVSQSAAQTAYNNFVQSPATVSTLVDFFLLVFGLALGYFWVLQAIGGATLGQRALGLRVVNATNRSSIGVKAAGIRTVVFLAGPAIFAFAPKVAFLTGTVVSTFGAILWFADCLLLVTDAQKRSLHDRAAATLVVRKSSLDQQRKQPSTPW